MMDDDVVILLETTLRRIFEVVESLDGNEPAQALLMVRAAELIERIGTAGDG